MTWATKYEARLQAAGNTLGLQLDDAQKQALFDYLEQLQRWNRTYNLTALRDPEQMLVQHVFDSLSVVQPLKDRLYKYTDTPAIVDVGSGAGLPGVVLAIMYPQATVHCVDTVEKKATFVRYVAGKLRLSNLHAHHARIESLPSFEADVVVSRAFSSLVDFVTLAGKHIRPEGVMLAMKGHEPVEEIAELHGATSWRVGQIDPLQVPELDAQRCLLWLTEQGTV